MTIKPVSMTRKTREEIVTHVLMDVLQEVFSSMSWILYNDINNVLMNVKIESGRYIYVFVRDFVGDDVPALRDRWL